MPKQLSPTQRITVVDVLGVLTAAVVMLLALTAWIGSPNAEAVPDVDARIAEIENRLAAATSSLEDSERLFEEARQDRELRRGRVDTARLTMASETLDRTGSYMRVDSSSWRVAKQDYHWTIEWSAEITSMTGKSQNCNVQVFFLDGQGYFITETRGSRPTCDGFRRTVSGSMQLEPPRAALIRRVEVRPW